MPFPFPGVSSHVPAARPIQVKAAMTSEGRVIEREFLLVMRTGPAVQDSHCKPPLTHGEVAAMKDYQRFIHIHMQLIG